MKCLHCDGKGHRDPNAFGNEICPYCDGTGKIILTNEEWFCGLPTEEKAKALAKVITEKGHYGCASDFIFQCNYVFWKNWLKEANKE